jgi:hypothetical protein
MFPIYVLQWTDTSGIREFVPYDRSISDQLAYTLDAAFRRVGAIEDWWIGDIPTNSMYDFRFCHLLVRDEVE